MLVVVAAVRGVPMAVVQVVDVSVVVDRLVPTIRAVLMVMAIVVDHSATVHAGANAGVRRQRQEHSDRQQDNRSA